MKVKELMTQDPVCVAADASLQDAAEKMRDVGCGILPVGSADSLEGMITDRDIVIRAIAEGKNPATEKVRDYMTPQVHACSESDTLKDAAEGMHRHNVSRLVVNDANGKVSGILTFGCILRDDTNSKEVADVVANAVGRPKAA